MVVCLGFLKAVSEVTEDALELHFVPLIGVDEFLVGFDHEADAFDL